MSNSKPDTMLSSENALNQESEDWHRVMPMLELREKSPLMKRINGKQVAFFIIEDEVFACDNRCPHEGFPLSEGSVSDSCTLTCNWHNWKFNLQTGENLFGGDKLRTYPLRINNGEIHINLIEPPYSERYSQITNNLRDAFDDYSYDRLAREIARLIKLGGDPLDSLRLAIFWSWDRLEFGWTHAFAGMADWLLRYKELIEDDESQLMCLVESVSHCSYDVLREPVYQYTTERKEFNREDLIESIEREDEKTAIALVLDGLDKGLHFEDFEPALSIAALRHYNDFGHSAIYVTKIEILIDGLGDSIEKPLLLSLVRNLIFASREDKIPEFRAYTEYLGKWGHSTPKASSPDHKDWWGKSINHSMQAVIARSDYPHQDIYRALLLSNAENLLSFDIDQQYKTHISVSGNVGWLDFTHGLTFANAVRKICLRHPQLWSAGLLQMACFNGRNTSFTSEQEDRQKWFSDHANARISELLEAAMDHGQGEHIISVHWLKTVLAVREEMELLSEKDGAVLLAAVTRFIRSPLKRRQVRRTAYQSLQFVAKE